jgi:hypothetical protein
MTVESAFPVTPHFATFNKNDKTLSGSYPHFQEDFNALKYVLNLDIV